MSRSSSALVWFGAAAIGALVWFMGKSAPALQLEPGRAVRWRDPSALDEAVGLSGYSSGIVYRKVTGHDAWEVRRDVDGRMVSIFSKDLEVTG